MINARQSENAPIPQENGSIPQENAPIPQENAPIPQENAPIPQENGSIPQENAPIPQENAPIPQDKWDILEIMGKSIFAIAIPSILTIWAIRSEAQKQSEAKESRQAEVLIQALSSQDIQRAQIKKDMLKELVKDFFTKEEKIEQQILILELLAFNFSNRQFKLGPLFGYLEKKVEDSADTLKDDYIQEMKRVIYDLKNEEISQILGTGGNACPIKIKVNETIKLNNYNKLFCPNIFLPVTIKLLESDDKMIKLEYKDASKTFQFKVTYFDTPFSDNTQLNLKPGVNRTFSIVLIKSDSKDQSAEISLVIFPEHFYSGEVSTINLDKLLGERFIKRVH